MDKVQEGSRSVCKLCNKEFLSAKSLGGHMRSHVVSNPSGKSVFPEFVNGGQSGYVLRENPKKTWRAVGTKVERVCKQCGKGFQSLKALCGHMACHSDGGLKDNRGHEHELQTGENPRMAMDSHSDTEMGVPRSSKGFKKVVENESSSVSEIDGDEEDVEVAMCLMLLSMDYGGGVNSVFEASDNNSVVLATKSSSTEGLNHIHSQDEMKKIAPTDDSDSAYFLDESAKTESDVSVDVFQECKKPAMIKTLSTQLNKMSNKNLQARDESRKRKRSSSENASRRMLHKSTYGSSNGQKPLHSYKRSNELPDNSRDSSTDHATSSKVVNSSKKQKASVGSSSRKKIKVNKNEGGHACPFCNKVFKNGQALGGHKRSHLVSGQHEGNRNPSPAGNPNPNLPAPLDLNLPAPEADDD